MTINKHIILLSLFIGLFVFAIPACKKDTPSRSSVEDNDSTNNGNNNGDNDNNDNDSTGTDMPSEGTSGRKVLFISIDGVSGKVLKELAPANISGLLSHAKYSYNVINDRISTDASSWVTMLTGKDYEHHQVKDFADADASDPKTIFEMVHENKDAYKRMIVTPDQDLSAYAGDIDKNLKVDNDELVKDSVISLLESSPSLGLMVADFKSAEDAGNDAGDFTIGNQNYKDAINTIDGYIGSIVDALTNRDNYDEEDWLVVITTDHGGSEVRPVPGFVVMYSPKLIGAALPHNGFNTIHFGGEKSNPVIATVSDFSLFNFGSGDFTAQMQIKYSSNEQSWQGIFGKYDADSYLGWTFAHNSNEHFEMYYGDKGAKHEVNGNYNQETPYPKTEEWHTMTMTVGQEDTSDRRIIQCYVDGVRTLDIRNITSVATLSSNNVPLTLGYVQVGGSAASDFYATNILLFNKRLDATTIADYYDMDDYTQHPDAANLIGYWKADEGVSTVIHNYAPQAPAGSNMILSGPFSWENIGDDVPDNVEAKPAGATTIATNADLVTNILYWMNMPISNLDGNRWMSDYSDEFNN